MTCCEMALVWSLCKSSSVDLLTDPIRHLELHTKEPSLFFLSLKATEIKGTASSINYFGHKFLANMINRTGNSGVLPSLEGFK